MRRPDWRTRLVALIDARRNTPFQWGAADCCLFAADAVAAMTDRDFAAPLRGYRSAAGAVRALRRCGFANVEAFVAAQLPRAERVRFGDVALAPAHPLDALMICDGLGGVWGQDAHGLVRLPLPASAAVWSV